MRRGKAGCGLLGSNKDKEVKFLRRQRPPSRTFVVIYSVTGSPTLSPLLRCATAASDPSTACRVSIAPCVVSFTLRQHLQVHDSCRRRHNFLNLDSFAHRPAGGIFDKLQDIIGVMFYNDPSGLLINTQTQDVVVATNTAKKKKTFIWAVTIGGSRLRRTLHEAFLRRKQSLCKSTASVEMRRFHGRRSVDSSVQFRCFWGCNLYWLFFFIPPHIRIYLYIWLRNVSSL